MRVEAGTVAMEWATGLSNREKVPTTGTMSATSRKRNLQRAASATSVTGG